MSLTIPSIILDDARDKGHRPNVVICAKVLYCQMRRDGMKDPNKSALSRQYGVTIATIDKWLKVIEDYGWGLDGKPDDRFGEAKKQDPIVRVRVSTKAPAWADAETQEAMREFYEHRRRLKKPVSTSQSAVRLCNRLTEVSGADNAKARQILQRSIDSGWSDVYPLKEAPKDASYGF